MTTKVERREKWDENNPDWDKRWLESVRKRELVRKLKRNKMSERNEVIAEKRRKGASLSAIGKEHGMSRENVRLILKKWYPNEVFPSVYLRSPRVARTCSICGTVFTAKNSSTKKFCTQECHIVQMKRDRLDPEEKTRRNRERARHFYEIVIKGMPDEGRKALLRMRSGKNRKANISYKDFL